MNPDVAPRQLLARALLQACREGEWHVIEHCALALASCCEDADGAAWLANAVVQPAPEDAACIRARRELRISYRRLRGLGVVG